ncbi:MAG: response regulator transcription factor [Bacillota bacterium]
MSDKKILIIEDEDKIIEMTANYLKNEGFEVVHAKDGPAGLEAFNNTKPDLILLDVMMPGMNGLDVCRELRKVSKVPIIMLTARADEVDKLLGLEFGADDYITKPFSLRELTARIKAVLRRATPGGNEETAEVINAGSLQINLNTREVTVAGKPVALTPTEFNILSLLVKNQGRVYSRLQILESSLGEAYEGYERSIDSHISNLRHKIETDPANRFIQTVYGVGYKFLKD